MELLNKLKIAASTITSKIVSLKDKLYMEKGSALVCKDKEGIVNKSVEIVAEHIDHDADTVLDFPQFTIKKITSRDGQYNMITENVLVLDADEDPTEGSKKLVTSGKLFDIIVGLQGQIDDIYSKITK